MTATYEEGRTAGIEAARRGLVEHQRIALGWAAARVQTIDARSSWFGPSDYQRGYTAGYRSVLVGFIHSHA